jgi:hypothetical protein
VAGGAPALQHFLLEVNAWRAAKRPVMGQAPA